MAKLTMPPFPLPVLAFDREVIGIIAFVIWILGMIIRAVKNNQEQAQAPPRPKPVPDTRRMEIETFLEEIAGGAPNRPPVRPNPPKRPPVAKSGKKGAKPQPSAKSAAPNKPRVAMSEQHLAKADLGSGLRSHLSAYMQPDRMAAEVQKDLPNRIAKEVQADLGPARSTSSIAPTSGVAAVHPLMSMLREPQQVRHAIVLQEILQKPRALRRD